MIDKSILEPFLIEGKSSYKIAEELGFSPSYIRHCLKKHGLATKPYSKHSCACGESNPANFYDGMRSSCKACHNKISASRKKGIKTKIVMFKGGKCERCGYNKCQAALQLHHKDPSKKDPDYYSFANRSFEAYKDELELCELVCANCHFEIHYH